MYRLQTARTVAASKQAFLAAGMSEDPLRGRTIRWTFDDGPTAGVEYEHAFGPDGVVAYRQAAGQEGSDQGGHETRYEASRIRQGVVAVSYLAESGFTLTGVLDFDSGRVVAFASNEEQLVVQQGTFTERPAGAASARREAQRPARPRALQPLAPRT